ncbi:endonuclease-reverse transcriptase [Elysia marginata]|uniref:Endonuclease-reverse transcriptase n=1 Tax=Elysia marginata TaxID=1093978 RepID=A0AAV4JBS4_9GAST|nr:endonuclease-reverse transcriptase [Elysia marginata]
MKKGPITCLEIEKAIAKSKSNRAPCEDRITADMLEADPSMSAKCLVGLFNKVWTEEKVPDAWKKGILILKKEIYPSVTTGEALTPCLFLARYFAGSFFTESNPVYIRHSGKNKQVFVKADLALTRFLSCAQS